MERGVSLFSGVSCLGVRFILNGVVGIGSGVFVLFGVNVLLLFGEGLNGFGCRITSGGRTSGSFPTLAIGTPTVV